MKKKFLVCLLCLGIFVPETVPYAASMSANDFVIQEDIQTIEKSFEEKMPEEDGEQKSSEEVFSEKQSHEEDAQNEKQNTLGNELENQEIIKNNPEENNESEINQEKDKVVSQEKENLNNEREEERTEVKNKGSLEPDKDGFVIENGVLLEYKGYAQELVIPDNVTSIGTLAFINTNVKHLTMSDSVTTIAEEAFLLSKIETIKLSNAIKVIPEGAFSNSNLKEITLPDSVTTIEKYAFINIKDLKITIPKSVTSIHYKAMINEYYTPTIYCYAGSEAERFAKTNGIKYKLMDLPQAVTNLKAISEGKRRVKLSWTKSPKAEGYLIYGQKNGIYDYVGMTTKTSFIDTKALDLEYNFYWVFPYITNFEGDKFPGACPKYVYAKGLIPAVQNLKASSVKGGVKLTWTKRNEAEGYLVYGRRAGGKYDYIGMTTKGTTFIDTKASKKEYNFYWVYPYHKNNDKMIVGGTPKYTYGKAL